MSTKRKSVSKVSRIGKRGDYETLCRTYGEQFGDMDERDISRCARWKLHMLEQVDSFRNSELCAFWCACSNELESNMGISVVEIAMSNIINSRGMLNADKTVNQRLRYERDRELDSCSTRYRNSQERIAARYELEAIFGFVKSYSGFLGSVDNARRFIRKWWRDGDTSLRDGIDRAMENSITDASEVQNAGGGTLLTSDLCVRAESAARYMECSLGEFVREWIETGIEAVEEIVRNDGINGDVPLNRRERKNLNG